MAAVSNLDETATCWGVDADSSVAESSQSNDGSARAALPYIYGRPTPAARALFGPAVLCSYMLLRVNALSDSSSVLQAKVPPVRVFPLFYFVTPP